MNNEQHKDVGKYNKEVKGKKAVLKEEVFFYTGYHRTEKTKKTFKAGTTITAAHEVIGTGLTTFDFKCNKQVFQHVLRKDKFEYID
ncbi:gp40 [Bacillus phage G]|uniref:Gp40 n=1 Tax=Bacillus phage G TaxID=2884420 RepID=G3MBB0_9CAUD|nr:gp40 [Bacillus phage G]AEO93311.1 gp40 [Bacillus phage G]